MNKTIRSILAVFAGLAFIFATSIGTDAILETLHIFPPITEGLFVTWMLVIAFVYRSVYAVIGCYLTARLAPTKPMKHALILGGIGVVLSTLGTIAGWNLSPHWYPIALVISSLPCAWIGGKLYEHRMEGR